MSGTLINTYALGSLVTVKVSFLNEPAGVLAYVYEHYGTGKHVGISLITQNGCDLGGFSLDEQNRFLEYYGDTGQVYHFRSVTWLDVDWKKGVFKFAFDNPEKYRKQL